MLREHCKVGMKVKIYRRRSLSIGANLAISARLYVPGWALRETLESMKLYPNMQNAIVLASVDEQPVAVAVLYAAHIMVFCKPDFRRLGIGGACVKRLLKIAREPTRNAPYASEGISGTKYFWSKMGVSI